MKLLICGDSHVMALEGAFDRRAGAQRDTDDEVRVRTLFSFPRVLGPFFSVNRDGLALNHSKARGEVVALTGRATFQAHDDEVYALFLPYTTAAFIRHPVWLNTHAPWRSQVRHRQLVSDQAIQNAIVDHLQFVWPFLSALQELGIRFFVVEAPPQRGDYPRLQNQYPVTLELDRLARGFIAEKLDDMGIASLDCPPALYEGAPRQSVMRPEFHASRPGDFVHANDDAGDVYLDAITEHFRTTYRPQVN